MDESEALARAQGHFDDLDHPGWGRLLDGLDRFNRRHPVGCSCRWCLRAELSMTEPDTALLDDVREIVATLREYRHHPLLWTVYLRLKRHLRRVSR